MADQEKLAHWKALFKEHEESELSLTDFCARKQVKRPTYHYWKNRLKEADKVNSKAYKRASINMLNTLMDYTVFMLEYLGNLLIKSSSILSIFPWIL